MLLALGRAPGARAEPPAPPPRGALEVERRWFGTHDGYREGADLPLSRQRENGSWGDPVETAFAVLVLRRATSPPAVAVSGG